MTSRPRSFDPRRAGGAQGGRRRTVVALSAVGLVGSVAVTGLGALPAGAATPEVLEIDFATSTGAFQGGASGMLYGLGDEGVPTDAIVAGARPTNVTQKAPHGEQHPNGDPLEVEDLLFRNGGEYLMTNIQDYYPDWPYNGGVRPDDIDTYFEIIETVVTSVVEESSYPEKYVFVPFNEPDSINWYGDWPAMMDTWHADWKEAYETIKDVYPDARIAGPGDSAWRPERTREWLEFAIENDVMPDMFTWHELGVNNLSTYRSHYREYREIEAELGIDPLPVNITEYAMRRDMSVPGQLIQWLSMFEDTKVDAQTAYWTFAGNLNDNMAKNNSANGAWWLLKWYADLTGDTVQLTPPALDTVDTLQGIAALDESTSQATVIYGGGTTDVQLDMTGLPESFGDTVDVEVREARWTGQEGASLEPSVVVADRVDITDGSLLLDVPGDDRLSAFQVVITPAAGDAPSVDSTWRTEIEAEDTTLANVTAYNQPAGDPWTFAASGQRDVGSTNQVGSSLTWTVEVPEDGTYRLGLTAGVNGPDIGPGEHALFVDDELVGHIEYEAGFGWTYRGRAEILIDLDAGEHDLSVRMSADGTTLLPGSDISLDKFDLELVDGPETATYSAALARLDGAAVQYADEESAGDVSMSADASATFYVAVRDTGYYDVELDYATSGAAQVGLEVNRRAVDGLGADRSGDWESSARLHLASGINEIIVTSAEGISLSDLTVTRAVEADEGIYWTEAENDAALTLHGDAGVEDTEAPTNVSGQQVTGIGGDGNYAVLARPEGVDAGAYNLVVRYANAEKNTGHDYNTDVVTRFLDIAEDGGETTRGSFRHNYSWNGFWTHTVGVDLTTDGGDLVLSNTTGNAPNIDWLALAPLVAEVANVGGDAPDPEPTDPPVPTPEPTDSPDPEPTGSPDPTGEPTAPPTDDGQGDDDQGAGDQGAGDDQAGGQLPSTGVDGILIGAAAALVLLLGGAAIALRVRRLRAGGLT